MPHDPDPLADRKHIERLELLADLEAVDAVTFVEPCGDGTERLAIRFDLMESAKAVQLLIRFRVVDKVALLTDYKASVAAPNDNK